MRKEFKIKNKLVVIDPLGFQYDCSILIGNEKFSIYSHKMRTLSRETTIKILEANNIDEYKNICQSLKVSRFYYTCMTINITNGWIASDSYDINKIEERLDAGTYDIYTCSKAIFVLVKRSKDYIM